jgi:phospholipid transport system substrate-binding protein
MIRLNRRRYLALAAAFACAPIPAAADDTADVRAPIVTFYKGLEAAMKAGQAMPFRQRFDILARALDQVFDLETILRVSVGLRWSSIDAAARSTLLEAFRRFTVATYVANFDKYTGEKLEVMPDTRVVGEDRVAQSRIVSPSGAILRLDYLMRRTAGTWRVVDVLLDGSISRVAVQRSDFRTLLVKGDTAALLDSLRRKTADLSGGAMGS